MNTNHNRIKVSDLETNQPDKILTTNSEGELEFSNLNSIKNNSHNGLDYTQEGKALDARQGKVLKDLIDTKIDKVFGTSEANKLLGTDDNGDLKLYSLPTSSIYPAPFLNEVIADSYLPNNTGNFILKGSFFTPTMSVVIQGQTVNYLTFKSDNEVHANVTTGNAEGRFDVILNNGLSKTFPNALFIVLGTVFTPTEEEWINENTNIDLSVAGETSLRTFGLSGTAEWNKHLDYTKKIRFYFYPVKSPLGAETGNNLTENTITLTDIVSNDVYQIRTRLEENLMQVAITRNGNYMVNVVKTDALQHYYYIEYKDSTLTLITDNGIGQYFGDSLVGNLKVVAFITHHNFKGLKYVELAS